jgi:hypothetical protein
MKDFLKSIAPGIAALLGGPLAGMAVSALGSALGVSEPTQEKLTKILSSGSLTGEQIAHIQVAELKLKERLAELGVDLEKIALDLERVAAQAAESVNKTMQAESAAEHWPTYSWRPSIGFAVALNVFITSLVVAVAFGGVILLGKDAAPLAHIPAMIGAMAALIGVVSPILGIAAWFRGRMQADPQLTTVNKG